MTMPLSDADVSASDFFAFNVAADRSIQFLQERIVDVKAVAIIYETLLGGVPYSEFFHFRVQDNVVNNYGGLSVVPSGNAEAIYVNVATSLIRDNSVAATAFGGISNGLSLKEMIFNIYGNVVPVGRQSAEGLTYLLRDEAIQFYKDAAQARGLGGDFGAAIVAFGALMNILVETNVGRGNAANDLARSLMDGAWPVPGTNLVLLPLETMDGTIYDADDAAAFVKAPAPLPAVSDSSSDWWMS